MNQNKGQTVGYARVSTADQNTARQIEAIGEVDRLYEDKASGKSIARPELERMLDFVRDGDRVRVASMDRLARNLRDLLGLVERFGKQGVEVEFIKENLTFRPDGSDATSDLLLSIMGAVAQFERSLILERQREGIAAAKGRGEYEGRGGRPKALTEKQVTEARLSIEAGEPMARVARRMKVGRSSLYRALKSQGTYAEQHVPQSLAPAASH